jgi:hypothetical protein
LQLQERGFYRLKPECWREFDVLFLHFSKGELEEALVSRLWNRRKQDGGR